MLCCGALSTRAGLSPTAAITLQYYHSLRSSMEGRYVTSCPRRSDQLQPKNYLTILFYGQPPAEQDFSSSAGRPGRWLIPDTYKEVVHKKKCLLAHGHSMYLSRWRNASVWSQSVVKRQTTIINYNRSGLLVTWWSRSAQRNRIPRSKFALMFQ